MSSREFLEFHPFPGLPETLQNLSVIFAPSKGVLCPTSQSRIRSTAPLKRGAIDKEISFRSNTRCCDKTSPPQSLPLSGEVASSEAKMTERLYRAAPALFRSLERRPLSNLSDACGASSPSRGALGKEVSFSMKLICVCRKTSRNAKASPTRGGGIERSEDVGEVVQSSTCVLRSI